MAEITRVRRPTLFNADSAENAARFAAWIEGGEGVKVRTFHNTQYVEVPDGLAASAMDIWWREYKATAGKPIEVDTAWVVYMRNSVLADDNDEAKSVLERKGLFNIQRMGTVLGVELKHIQSSAVTKEKEKEQTKAQAALREAKPVTEA